MTNKNYAKGRAKEYRVMKKLEREGWFVVRSSGSHGPVDLVAFKHSNPIVPVNSIEVAVVGAAIAAMTGATYGPIVRLIQCKPKGGYLTPAERKAKSDLERRLGIPVEVV